MKSGLKEHRAYNVLVFWHLFFSATYFYWQSLSINGFKNFKFSGPESNESTHR